MLIDLATGLNPLTTTTYKSIAAIDHELVLGLRIDGTIDRLNKYLNTNTGNYDWMANPPAYYDDTHNYGTVNSVFNALNFWYATAPDTTGNPGYYLAGATTTNNNPSGGVDAIGYNYNPYAPPEYWRFFEDGINYDNPLGAWVCELDDWAYIPCLTSLSISPVPNANEMYGSVNGPGCAYGANICLINQYTNGTYGLRWQKSGCILTNGTAYGPLIAMAGTNSAAQPETIIAFRDLGGIDVVQKNGSGSWTVTAWNTSLVPNTNVYVSAAVDSSGQIFAVRSGAIDMFDLSTTAALTSPWNVAPVTVATGNYSQITADPTRNMLYALASCTGPPAITSQPAAQAVCSGNTATFTVGATGTGLTYQWYGSGGSISGATSASYTTGVADSYYCVVTDACGATTSSAATLTVNTAPAITTNPRSQTICSGTATFTVAASGTPTPSYQWYNASGAISGATSSTYTTGAAASYYCIATNSCSSRYIEHRDSDRQLGASDNDSASEPDYLLGHGHIHGGGIGHAHSDLPVVQGFRRDIGRHVFNVYHGNGGQLLLHRH